MKTYHQAKDIALSITSAFEGTGYTLLVGNFDGQGFTFGLLGFCLGQGTLQQVIKDMYKADPAAFKECATVYVEPYKSTRDLTTTLLGLAELPAKQAVEWATFRQKNNKPDEHWRTVFRNLGNVPKFRNVQNKYADKIFTKAVQYCTEYRLNTVRALALFFDCCTQQGSMKTATKARAIAKGVKSAEYKKKLEILAIAMSTQARTQYQKDVLSRRLCIARGTGNVHGKYWDLAKFYGLDDEEFTLPTISTLNPLEKILKIFKRNK